MSSLTKHRIVKYIRHEFHGDPEPREGSLLTFVYDIPYFCGCGVFPPSHIVNQVFSEGGGAGGMSPGATWDPFKISQEEYDQLTAAITNTPISKIQPYARYAELPMKIDHEFDHIQDRIEWVRAACGKHRDRWHDGLNKIRCPQK